MSLERKERAFTAFKYTHRRGVRLLNLGLHVGHSFMYINTHKILP